MPFIGDNGTLYIFTTSKKLTGSLNATIPQGKDAGHTALISGALNGTFISLALVTTTGYTVTVASGIITKATMKQEAKGTVTLAADFTASGGFNIA